MKKTKSDVAQVIGVTKAEFEKIAQAKDRLSYDQVRIIERHYKTSINKMLAENDSLAGLTEEQKRMHESLDRLIDELEQFESDSEEAAGLPEVDNTLKAAVKILGVLQKAIDKLKKKTNGEKRPGWGEKVQSITLDLDNLVNSFKRLADDIEAGSKEVADPEDANTRRSAKRIISIVELASMPRAIDENHQETVQKPSDIPAAVERELIGF